MPDFHAIEVTVLAVTEPPYWPEEHLPPDESIGPEHLIEYAGRSCYQSWGRPNPKTASVSDYTKNIIRQGHESVLEHVNVSLLIEGVSRNMTHELVRHRHFSFSQRSGRYVSEPESFDWTIEHFIDDIDLETADEVMSVMRDIGQLYTKIQSQMRASGRTKKEANQAARMILPGGLHTSLVLTGNLRTFRDMLGKRLAPGADPEIRAFARRVCEIMMEMFPAVFEDFQGMMED